MISSRETAPSHLKNKPHRFDKFLDVESKALNLSCFRNGLFDTDMPEVAEYVNEHKIEFVSLIQNNLTSAGAVEFARLNRSAKVVNFGWNHIDAEGVQGIVQANKANGIIKE